ncbi:prolyl oligopeptidase family serine peptidase [Aestuariimicrobium soli]|uniref:prolyl oligopeptidase family serine peptidase n=1 Tax=Aestuariimicrobium soli TaxID=2035834 RepID=UPI003EBDC433
MSQSLSSLSRRAVLGTVAAVPLAGVAASALAAPSTTASVRFTLNATVLDGGEQVSSVSFDASALGPIDPASITTGTFTVHAKATSPIPNGGLIFSEYDLDRSVTSASIDNKRVITLELETAEGLTGGGTLGYLLNTGRNVELDLVYTITQNQPIRLKNGRQATISSFVQGDLVSPEVDAFSYGTSAGGMNYRLFTPDKAKNNGNKKFPLVVWLHGGGEGGMGTRQTNEAQLRANRGALGFATPEAQAIFGGAYVVAPQCVSAWMSNGPLFAPQIKALIDELVKKHNVDPKRISVLGCSNGGYMTLKMESDYPTFFAAGVPICCAATRNFFTDADLIKVRSTPTWLVHSKDDTTLPYLPNTMRVAGLVPEARLSLYENVTWNGYQYAGHWSWIYVAHNDPQVDGEHLWQWMAAQKR